MILSICEGVFLVQDQLIEKYVLEMRQLGSKRNNILN